MELQKSGLVLAVSALLFSGAVLADSTTNSNDFLGDDIASHNDLASHNNSNNTTTTGGGNDGNTTLTNSFNTATTTTNTAVDVLIESDSVVAEADLNGTVSNVSATNSQSALLGIQRVRASNSLDGFSATAGITTVGQNAGANSMVQQAVSTNASVFTN